jgi:hypothetical protein
VKISDYFDDSFEKARKAMADVLNRPPDGVARPVKDRRELGDWFKGFARACRALRPKEPK